MSAWRAELERLTAQARAGGETEELIQALWGALDELRLGQLEGAQGKWPGRYGMISGAPEMQPIFALIERVAPSDVPVLVHGETGTGKELVAHALHARSRRAKKTFLAENCAAVPANLLESELFGHKKGSFTHAVADRPGHFVTANGGTLFLDEIGDMPLEMQSKLLRVLESGELRPVGSSQTVRVDVRIVAATHRDLEEMVRKGLFREDLFYRLNVVRIVLPALRERSGDVELLTRYFLGKFAAPGTVLSDEALAALGAYSWPGNVRQLENELRRATALTRGSIGREDLSPDVLGASAGSTP